MEASSIDPRLLGLILPDEAFRQTANDLLRNQASSAASIPRPRQQLQHLTLAFFRTSENLDMQRLMLKLHDAYDFGTLFDPALLSSMRNKVTTYERFLQANKDLGTDGSNPNIIAAQLDDLLIGTGHTLFNDARRSHDKAVKQAYLNQRKTASTPQGKATSAEATEETGAASADDTKADNGDPAETSDQQTLDTDTDSNDSAEEDTTSTTRTHTNAEAPIKCHPPNLPRARIDKRDQHWFYQCDLCSHLVRFRDEFHRHFRKQDGIRPGFLVISAEPSTGPHKWYGIDSQGNEYIGNMIHNPSGGEKQRTFVAPPCGPRINSHANTETETETETEKETAAESSSEVDDIDDTTMLDNTHSTLNDTTMLDDD
ncbi:hypothetical protein H2200_003482 [Cladophialophora chaetospira]|uniref:C2H2-type domain-containing protein n=1 Tax=Cladophialophora chaetospira TaxID=386627 RepID=A0AA38XHF8_9EURO|nr:hypothetical protein H2200_003482 [Cladophialophora chaetospira]